MAVILDNLELDENLKVSILHECQARVDLRTDNQFHFCVALLKLLIITAESLLSKRPALSITVAFFLLLTLFSSHLFILFQSYTCFY